MSVLNREDTEILAQKIWDAADLIATVPADEAEYAAWKVRFTAWREDTFGIISDKLSYTLRLIYQPVGLFDAKEEDDDEVFNDEHRKLQRLWHIYLERVRTIVLQYGTLV